jgi:hypothetical protein
MEGKFVGISVRNIPIISEFGDTLFTCRTVFSAPIRLLEILWLLEYIEPQKEGVYDIPGLQQLYLDKREEINEDFNIPCEESTTREGDFNDPVFCGDLQVPNPVCPLCEMKLRLFRLIQLEEDEEVKHILEVHLDLLFSRTRGSDAEFQVSTVVAALRDLKTVRSFPNATIIAWTELGEENIIEELNEVPRYWF